MLLRFEVENHRSIAERQDLSLVAGKMKGNDAGLIPIPGAPSYMAVPVALIYGANASGKTNFVRALTFVKSAILFSHSRGNPKGGVPREPFALNDGVGSQPSMFEVEFVVKGTRYIFGFTCDDRSFLTEWLYSFPEGKRRKLYEREGKRVDFGSSMIGSKKSLVDFMRDNSLFISTATQNDHEHLTEIVEFFKNIQYSSNLSVSSNSITNTFKEGQIDPRVIDFLESTGAGIVGLEQTRKEVPEQVKIMKADFISMIQKRLGDDVQLEVDSDDADVEIRLLHQANDVKRALPLEFESTGTRRLLLVLSKILRALDKGALIVVDELDASLHTLISEQIIGLFSDKEINQNGSQLLATTHDTNTLSCNKLRRDQIWLCEKDNLGVSRISSLAEFRLRSTDQFEKGYLDGRFGAIPFSGDVSAFIHGKL